MRTGARGRFARWINGATRTRRVSARRGGRAVESLEQRTLLSTGDLDPAWGGDGTVVTDFGGSTSDRGRPVAIQADGKILQAGWHQIQAPGGDLNFGLVRLNPEDGSVDTTFGDNGRVVIDFDARGDLVNAIAVAPDGKIVVAGNSSFPVSDPFAPDTDIALARLNPDGSLDTTFDGDGKKRINIGAGPAGAPTSSDYAWNMLVQPDGKILTAGGTNAVTNGAFTMARLNLDGSLDPTFGAGDGLVYTQFTPAAGTPFGGTMYGIDLDDQGRIVTSGGGGTDTRNTESIIARYTPDGAFDPTFDGDGWVLNSFSTSLDVAYSVIVAPDGQIVAAGHTYSDTIPIEVALSRFNPDGSFDTSFGTGGRVTFGNPTKNDQALLVQIDAAGGVLVAGRSSQSTVGAGNAFVGRVDSAGVPDESFGPNGIREVPELDETIGFVLQPADGYLLMSGADTPPDGGFDDFALARLDPAGTLDPFFGGDGVVHTDFTGGAWNVATTVAVQPDGKVVVGGWVNPDNFTARDFAFARYNPDGTLDDTFGDRGRVTYDLGLDTNFVAKVVIDPEGRIVGVGTGVQPVNVEHVVVFRLNPDGSPDSSFGIGGTTQLGNLENTVNSDARGHDLVLLPDGRIAVAGEWSNSTTNSMFAVVMLNDDGTPDTSFGFDGVVREQLGTNNYSYARSIALIPDGQDFDLIVAGSAVTTTDSFALLRLNLDGRPDTKLDGDGKFTTNFGNRSSFLTDVAVDPQGRMVAVGYATVSTPQGNRTDFAVARLFPTGFADPFFGTDGKVLTDFGIGGRDQANALLLGPDGSIFVGGFTESINPPSGSTITSRDFGIVRYDTTGALLTQWGGDGRVVTDFGGDSDLLGALAFTPDGRLVAAGMATTRGTPTSLATGQDFAVARYLLTDENQTPISRPGGPYTTNEGTPITLSGAASTDDGTIDLYEWDFDYDHQNFTAEATGVQVQFPAADGPLNRTVALRVRDDDGVYKIAWTQLTVNNVAPTIDAGPDLAIDAGTGFSTDVPITDPGADTFTATADYGDGTGPQPLPVSPGGVVTFGTTYANPGTYTVTVTVRDDDGGEGTDTMTVTVTAPPARVSRRDVFYNNSAFDGNNAGLDAGDFDAVALGKAALLPNQTATFANYTSYARGINGVMVSFSGAAAAPTLADFVFRKGADDTPGDWQDAGAPSGFDVRPLAGGPGGYVAVFTFPDGSLRNTWLQVTVLPTERTNLPFSDVHYWGNLVGETGAGPGVVNVMDQARTRAAVSSRNVNVLNAYDFNRNGRVDSADVLFCRANSGRTLAHIRPHFPPEPAPAANVFHDGPAISRSLTARRRLALLEV